LLCAEWSTRAQEGFSHKAALESGLDCLTCHAAQKDSTSLGEKRKGRVLKDFNHSFHLKFGNIAPLIRSAIASKKYLGSPHRIDIPKLQNHLAEANNACQACHRGLKDSTSAPGKEHFPHMEDCLVCHNKIDNPFSCAECHGEKDAVKIQLKPSNHAPDFLDRHTTGKLNLDKTTCAACHGQRFTCLGCH
jgi:hypothetical protein